MHHIQTKILHNLLYVESSNYAGLRPEGVESNHFAYHLDRLLRDGLIIKTEKRYRLSPSGLSYVDRLSQERMISRMQATIVTAIDISAPTGKHVLYERRFQPFINRVELPMGKVHLNESIADAAARELNEKTGLSDVPLTYRGMAYVSAAIGGVMITKKLYHIFQGALDTETPLSQATKRGEAFWGDFRDIGHDRLMPGFLDIQTLLARSKPDLFFDEYAFDYGE